MNRDRDAHHGNLDAGTAGKGSSESSLSGRRTAAFMNKPDSRACRKGAMSEPQLAMGTCNGDASASGWGHRVHYQSAN